MRIFFALLVACLTATLAHAQQSQPQKIYTQTFPLCPVHIDFLERPEVLTACNPQNPLECHDVAVYRHVEGPQEALKIRVACQADQSPALPDDKAMVQSLQVLLTDSRMREYEGDVVPHGKDVKQAIFMAVRDDNGALTNIMGQLWVGRGWRYTLVAEHTGASPILDDMFYRAIKSVRLKPEDKTEDKTKSKPKPVRAP